MCLTLPCIVNVADPELYLHVDSACIHLLSALHLYEEAVDLSLREVTDGMSFLLRHYDSLVTDFSCWCAGVDWCLLGHGDYKLAKENADKPKDEGKKKKLWLRIAKHMLRSKVMRTDVG